jgi:hypothetical protein
MDVFLYVKISSLGVKTDVFLYVKISSLIAKISSVSIKTFSIIAKT